MLSWYLWEWFFVQTFCLIKKSIIISVLAVESKPKILMHFRDNFVNRNRMKSYNIVFAFKYLNQMHILFEIDFLYMRLNFWHSMKMKGGFKSLKFEKETWITLNYFFNSLFIAMFLNQNKGMDWGECRWRLLAFSCTIGSKSLKIRIFIL